MSLVRRTFYASLSLETHAHTHSQKAFIYSHSHTHTHSLSLSLTHSHTRFHSYIKHSLPLSPLLFRALLFSEMADGREGVAVAARPQSGVRQPTTTTNNNNDNNNDSNNNNDIENTSNADADTDATETGERQQQHEELEKREPQTDPEPLEFSDGGFPRIVTTDAAASASSTVQMLAPTVVTAATTTTTTTTTDPPTLPKVVAIKVPSAQTQREAPHSSKGFPKKRPGKKKKKPKRALNLPKVQRKIAASNRGRTTTDARSATASTVSSSPAKRATARLPAPIQPQERREQRHVARNLVPSVDVQHEFFKPPMSTHQLAGHNSHSINSNVRIVIPQSSKKTLYADLKRLCDKRDYSMLQTLVDNHVDIDSRNGAGQTVLMHAATLGESGLSLLEFLLQACGADPNCQNTQGSTPLHLASERRKVCADAVHLLTRFGANQSLRDALGRRPKDVYKQKQFRLESSAALRKAVKLGNVFEVERLLQRGASPDTTVRSRRGGETVLMMAVKNEHVGMVQLLLEGKADPSLKESEEEMTALHFAMERNQDNANIPVSKIVTLLEKYGANTIARNKRGFTPLKWQKKLAQEANGSLPYAFKRVILEGDEAAVQMYLEDGFASSLLNARDDAGRTALMYATISGHVGICEKLLKAKANPDLQEVNHRGNTALHFAYTQQSEEIMDLFDEYSANRSASNLRLFVCVPMCFGGGTHQPHVFVFANTGRDMLLYRHISNALGFTCISAQRSAMALERAKRNSRFVSPTVRAFRHGRVPQKEDLHEAICEKYNRNTVKKLISTSYAPIYIDGKDEAGNTYLHLLVQDGTTHAKAMLQWLVKHMDADVDARNNQGWTPLHLA